MEKQQLTELNLAPESEGFVVELEAKVSASNQFMFAMKAGESCKVDFWDEDGNVLHLEGVPMFDKNNHGHALMKYENGAIIPVPFSKVIRCEIEARLR